MHIDVATLDQQAIAKYTTPGQMQSTVDFLLNIIPTSVFDAFARGDMLQVLFFSILFCFALQRLGGRENILFQYVEKSSEVLFGIVGMLMKLAPVGAFGQWRLPLVSMVSELCGRSPDLWRRFI